MAGKTGAKGKKIGRDKTKCDLYRKSGKTQKNAIRKATTLLNRLEKRGIRPKDQEVLRDKIKRLKKAV
ncbi:MAG: hypothetical protein RBT05_06925 [Bacteroidales bacterium]|jgi:hypothetical protein|nr:hypothetical protein [Bacteroidales bacterium]